MKMYELKPGETARVTNLKAKGLIRRRLLDLGLVPGTKIESIRKSPLGDPILFDIRGAMIALRKEESQLVHISSQEDA